MTKGLLGLIAALSVTAAVVTASPCAGAEETGANHLGEARSAVEGSALPKEAKAGILKKADRAAATGVPAEDISVIVSRGLHRGVAGGQIEGFLETAAGAKERHLPVRLLLDRIEQGLAKGVPTDRIADVTQRLSGHLADAAPIVDRLESRGMRATGKNGSDDAVETVARALELSIPRDAVVKTGESVKERKGSLGLFNRAVDTMTTFVGDGMTREQAVNMVHRAVEKGYGERDLAAMESYVADARRKNRPMSDVVSDMNSRMEQGEMYDTQMRDGMQGGAQQGPGSGGMGGMSGMGGRR